MAKRKTPTKNYIQMTEGVWYAVQHDIELTECCDCGLVHRTYWKVERGRIYWRAAVDQRLTKKARERSGITINKLTEVTAHG
jgi:hypothetical protein